MTALAQHVYAAILARRGLFAILALAATALLIGAGAMLELMQANAGTSPGNPQYICKTYYGPGGNTATRCWWIG